MVAEVKLLLVLASVLMSKTQRPVPVGLCNPLMVSLKFSQPVPFLWTATLQEGEEQQEASSAEVDKSSETGERAGGPAM